MIDFVRCTLLKKNKGKNTGDRKQKGRTYVRCWIPFCCGKTIIGFRKGRTPTGSKTQKEKEEKKEVGEKLKNEKVWQYEASSRVVIQFREDRVLVQTRDSDKSLVRPQGGSGAGLALSACPTSWLTRFEPQQFLILLRRRLRLLLPLTGVASHSILVSITELPARGQGVGQEGVRSGERCCKEMP